MQLLSQEAGEKGDVYMGKAGCRSQRSTEVPMCRATQARRKGELKNQILEFGIKLTNKCSIYISEDLD